jgi:hypothetical protein
MIQEIEHGSRHIVIGFPVVCGCRPIEVKEIGVTVVGEIILTPEENRYEPREDFDCRG